MTKLLLSVILIVSAYAGADLASSFTLESGLSVPDRKEGISAVQRPVRYDFDGDGKADISVFRPSTGVWYIANSGGGYSILQFGLNGDLPMAADYDGDGKTDISVYRGGTWYRLKSLTGTVDVINFGVATDVPVPSDFDGDQKADIAVFRPSDGTWHRLNSSNGQYVALQFGTNGDIPLAGDYDADGKADINLFRPSSGVWYRINSSNGSVAAAAFGANGDVPLAGDFDGDLKSDLAVWRPSTGAWWILRSSDGLYSTLVFGLSTDIPVPADYDGDGKADIAVFRPSTGVWHRLQSSNGTYSSMQFGVSTDIPVTTPTTPVPPIVPPASFTCDYYAATTGTASGTGSATNPWDLQTALGKTTLIRTGKTLCLRGGTYNGKYRSTLNGGGIVRSAPGEWAKIDGYKTTTLTQSVNATQLNFTVANPSGLYVFGLDDFITIDSENVPIVSVLGNTLTVVRNGTGTIGGAQPHNSGAVVTLAGTNFYVYGSSTTYRDFEVMNSLPVRNGDVTPELASGNGIINVGDSNKFVNLVVHDTMNGIFTSNLSKNTEIYGCLTYNNGQYMGDGTGKGHGMYLENSAGYSRVYESISLNNFNLGTQLFGVTASYVGGDIRGSVFANSGSPLGQFDPAQRNINLLVGTDSQRITNINIQDNFFFQPHTSNGSSLGFGYGAGIDNGSVINNYFVGGGGALLGAGNVGNATVTGNKFYSSAGYVYYTQVYPGSSYAWNNNTYYKAVGRSVYAVSGVDVYQMAGWRSNTGYDINSTETSTLMPETANVRPNSYQAGRANIIVYSPSRASSINVNLSTAGLTNGQGYVIKNAFNYGGPVVASGIYNSSSPNISLSLTGAAATVATPIGYNYTPPSTAPDFGIFILIPTT